MRRSRLRPVSQKTRTDRWPALAAMRAAVVARAEGRCEVCRAYVGTAGEVHHVVKRSHARDDSPDNGIYLCVPCHAATDSPRGAGRLVIHALGAGRFTWVRL